MPASARRSGSSSSVHAATVSALVTTTAAARPARTGACEPTGVRETPQNGHAISPAWTCRPHEAQGIRSLFTGHLLLASGVGARYVLDDDLEAPVIERTPGRLLDLHQSLTLAGAAHLQRAVVAVRVVAGPA